MDGAGADLSQEECWELLAHTDLGRVALSIHALPTIFPVHYSVSGRTVAICLGDHDLPTSSVNDAIIAFAVDAIDNETRSGWLVQMQGRALLPTTLTEPRCLRSNAGDIMHLNPGTVSGRRIDLCPPLPVR